MIAMTYKIDARHVIKSCTMYLMITSHPNSLEKVERKGQIVKIVGRGVMKSPGHPAGHQINSRQSDIFNNSTTHPYEFTIYTASQTGTPVQGFGQLNSGKVVKLIQLLTDSSIKYPIFDSKVFSSAEIKVFPDFNNS